MFFYLFNSAELRKAGRDFRKARHDFREAGCDPDRLHPNLLLQPEAHHQVHQKRPVSERKCVKVKEERQIRVCFSIFLIARS